MRRLVLIATAGLLGLALWQIGGATWIHGKAVLAQVLLERSWEARRDGATTANAKPWPWADTAPVARLKVPSLDIEQIILAGASGRTLAFGPGHLEGTAAPGARGHSIVSGHRDTHFTFLKDLNPGDQVQVERPDGQTVTYQVSGHQIVDARDARFIETPDQTVITLVTCYPFDAVEPNGPLRYVVFAESIEPSTVGDVEQDQGALSQIAQN